MRKFLFTMMTLCLAIGVQAQTKVTTNPFIAQGSTAALGRSTVTGTNISEKGFCWATHPNPTIADESSTKYYSNNGNIYEMSPLTSATFYYARAYAKTTTGEYVYGDVVKFVTKPKPSCTWSYNNGGSEEANERINAAAAQALELYNTWTAIRGFHTSINYGADTPTADCSYGGWMRVGPNASYQRTGTLLHEINHGVGGGTSSRWWDSNLRANGDRGAWLGERATQMVRFFENSSTAVLNGDTQHMWPYGINGANEDDNREITYIANVLITNAVHEDGLCPIRDYGCQPSYTFLQEDTIKYYITNADEKYGTGTAYLYDSAGTLKWKEVGTVDDLKANDQFAWYVIFNPATAYYRIRNAKSNRYFTYSGSTIKAATKSAPTASEGFQLLGNREYTTFGKNNKTFQSKSYWVMMGNNAFAPYALTATSNGGTNSTSFNTALSATTQRWFFLTEQEIKDILGASDAYNVSNLRAMINKAKELLDAPHEDKTEGATEALQTVITELLDRIDGMTDKDEIAASIVKVKDAANEFVRNAMPTDITKPFDLTLLISEPDFSTCYDWSVNDQAEPQVAYGVASFNSEKFKFTQTLTTTPVGVYALKVQAYQCPGELSQVAEDWAAGNNNAKSYIYYYVTSNKTVVKNIFEDAPDAPLGNGEGTFENFNGKYIPTDAKADSLCFAAGLYDNTVIYDKKNANDAPFGIVNAVTKQETQGKTAFTNFRLSYYGSNFTKDEVAANINTSLTTKPSVHGDSVADSPNTYNLSGQKVTPNFKGIVIRQGKKTLQR